MPRYKLKPKYMHHESGTTTARSEVDRVKGRTCCILDNHWKDDIFDTNKPDNFLETCCLTVPRLLTPFSPLESSGRESAVSAEKSLRYLRGRSWSLVRKSKASWKCFNVSPVPTCTSKPSALCHMSKVCTTLTASTFTLPEAVQRFAKYRSLPATELMTTPPQYQALMGLIKKSSRTKSLNLPPLGHAKLDTKSPMFRSRACPELSSQSGVRWSNTKG
mmetsp:Transcript_47666/g.110432  ORF Transcript_47666/g.110432 Transcript_47666/m.110432 type:complete len:218 (+) Transcript_47666:152-805(+)